MKKYEFTEETKQIGEVTLHRIRAAVDFYIVNTDGCNADGHLPPLTKIEKGTLGGWIEKEENLSQDGASWVADEACVYGKSRVQGAAVVSENATVSGGDIMDFARVYGKATVHDGCVSDHARIYDEARISGGTYWDHAQVFGKAKVKNDGGEELDIKGYAKIYDNATVWCSDGGAIDIDGNAQIFGFATVRTLFDCGPIDVGDNAKVCGNAEIVGFAIVGGEATVTEYSIIDNGAAIRGNAHIAIQYSKFGRNGQRIPPNTSLCKDAFITDPRDCLVISPFNSYPKNRFLTFYATAQKGINLSIEVGKVYRVISVESLREILRLDFEPERADLIADAATYALSYFKYQKAAKEAGAADELPESTLD